MLELFHETKEFYQLKELEKLCYKQKGIGLSLQCTTQHVRRSLKDACMLISSGMMVVCSSVAQSVKDVLQELCDEGTVAFDKVN